MKCGKNFVEYALLVCVLCQPVPPSMDGGTGNANVGMALVSRPVATIVKVERPSKMIGFNNTLLI